MGMTDNKVLSWNITWKQWLGLAALGAFCFVIVYTESLTLGYVIATLALSAFFFVVAFDIGVPKQRRLEEPAEPVEVEADARKTA
jgi:hypothetical protein